MGSRTERLNGHIAYTYQAYATVGIYELSSQINAETSEYIDSPYRYYFIAVDTADGVSTATVCYATKEAPTEQIKKSVSLSVSHDFDTLTIDGTSWTRDGLSKTTYTSNVDNVKSQINLVSYSVSEQSLESLVNERIQVANEQNPDT